MALKTSDNKVNIVSQRQKDTANVGKEKGIKTRTESLIKTASIKRYAGASKNLTMKSSLVNRNQRRQHSKNNKNNPIKSEYNNFIKSKPVVGRRIKTGKLDDKKSLSKKSLKETKVSNDNNDLGTDVIKSGYNGALKTKHVAGKTIKTGKAIKNSPKTINNTIKTLKNIPNAIHTMVDHVRKATITSIKEVYSIGSNLSKGKFKKAGKQIAKDSGIVLKKTFKSGKKVVKPSLNIGKNIGKAGIGEFNSNFKKAFTKSEGTEDVGTKTIATMATATGNTKIVASNIRKDLLITKNAVKNKIKTASAKRKIKTSKKRIDEIKNSYKGAKLSYKGTKKLTETFLKKMQAAAYNFLKLIFKNPVVAAIIALVIVVIMVLQMLLTTIIGVHGASTIDFESDANIEKWKVQMEKIDKATYTRIHSGDRLVIVNGSCKATWKDLMAVYYVKYGDMELNNNSTVSDGSSVNTVNPEAWNQIYEELKAHLGEDYVYGGSSPEIGFDCSGLVQYCFSIAGVNLPRTTYEQCQVGEDVTDMQPGDLVFFMGSDPQDGLPGHVGVYIGDDQYIHAPSTGDVIKISNLSSRSDFWGAKRVIQASDSSSSDNSNASSNSSNNSNTSSGLYETMDGTWADLFTKVGNEYNIDPILLASVAMQESSLDPNAVSGSGACGLCQMMPDTFTGLGFSLDDIFDPYTNCCACAMELNDLATRHSDLTEVLGCYNAGEAGYRNQLANGGLCSETANYASGVLSHYSEFSNGGLPDGKIGGTISIANSVSGNLKHVYDLFNEVKRSSRKKYVTYTLIKHDLSDVEDKLNMTKEEREWVDEILDYDNFEFFGEDYNFKFKLT